MRSLTEIIQDLVLDGPKPAKVISDEIGKPYHTLLREISPDDHGAKFGIESLLPLMIATGSIKPLEYLAARMGCRIVCLKSCEPDKATLLEELLDDYQAVSAFHQSMVDEKPLESVHELMEKAISELEQNFTAYRATGVK
jgi:hypothetical protein